MLDALVGWEFSYRATRSRRKMNTFSQETQLQETEAQEEP